MGTWNLERTWNMTPAVTEGSFTDTAEIWSHCNGTKKTLQYEKQIVKQI